MATQIQDSRHKADSGMPTHVTQERADMIRRPVRDGRGLGKVEGNMTYTQRLGRAFATVDKAVDRIILGRHIVHRSVFPAASKPVGHEALEADWHALERDAERIYFRPSGQRK